MDNREHVAAANALIQWFNSQEIPPSDASSIMLKVLAKILVGAVRGSHTKAQHDLINEGIDCLTLDLVHEINDRLYVTRERK